MNKTFEKAFNALAAGEREAIVSSFNGRECPVATALLDEALTRLFVLLRERKDGDLDGLSPFEERVLAKTVIAGNTLLDADYYR